MYTTTTASREQGLAAGGAEVGAMKCYDEEKTSPHKDIYFSDLTWDNIKQFLGIGKYYVANWRVGAIYIPEWVNAPLEECG